MSLPISPTDQHFKKFTFTPLSWELYTIPEVPECLEESESESDEELSTPALCIEKMHAHLKQMHACFESALQTNPFAMPLIEELEGEKDLDKVSNVFYEKLHKVWLESTTSNMGKHYRKTQEFFCRIQQHLLPDELDRSSRALLYYGKIFPLNRS